MLASYPISAFLPGINLNATLLSHGNSLDFGLLGDMHALPDLELVVERMAYHFEKLGQAVLDSPRGTGKPGKKTGKKTPAKARPKAKEKAAATPRSRRKHRAGTR